MRDTTPDAEQVQIRAIRRMAPVQRLQAALDLSEWARAVALEKLREMHPDFTLFELLELLLGEPLLPPGAARPRA